MLRAKTSRLVESHREAPAYTAVVTDSTAAFVLPIPEKARWDWNLPTTLNNKSEYRWDIETANNGRTYELGFYKFKFAGLEPARGTVEELIEAGQESLWESKPAGGSDVVASPGVSATPLAPGRVLISVVGRANVARVFSSRPSEVDVVVVTPGEPEIERTIPVVYSDGSE